MCAAEMLAIIPAKGASTRLPRKNVRALGGKPLMGWTIESALASGVFSDIVVSSEDKEILAVASQWPVKTCLRPSELAVDPAGCIHVAQYVQAKLEQEGKHYKRVAILMPTCPFRSSEDICAAVAMAELNQNGTVLSVAEYSHTPYNALAANDKNNLKPIITGFFGKKTQELPIAYRPNGGIFLMSGEVLKNASNLYVEPMHPYIMPPERSVDIDNEIDLNWAEFLLEQRKA